MDYSVIKVTPDPIFSVTDYNPPKAPPSGWLYARGEYEAFVLAKMRENVKKLKLYVGYPGQFRPPYTTVFYRHALPCGTYETCGMVTDMSTSGAKLLKITAPDIAQSLPALKSAEDGWEVSVDGVSFTAAQPGGVPTGDELPRVRLPLAEIEPGLYDTGREVLADITFRGAEKPSFNAGESIHEALHVTPEKYVQEQTFELEEIAPGVWKTPLPLAFRYIKLKSGAPDAIEIDAAYTPLVYRRTYDFGDEELNRIWACSAYTLRLCIHTFQIDGVKRDRLPWGGDLAISLLANAYSFREPEPIKRTLTVLGRDGTTLSQVNGILDYSLWIVISHECYQRHFDDPAFLDENYPAITQIVDSFIEKADAHGGLIRPAEKDWCFIDWLEIEKTTSLQMLFHWALVSAASLATRKGDTTRAAHYTAYAAQLKERIDAAAYDAEGGFYRGCVFTKDAPAVRHANFLAVLSGVADKAKYPALAKTLLSPDLAEAGTPYMMALDIWALHQLGHTAEALAKLRAIWGGMLKLGATTFFEGYEKDFDEVKMCIFYGRPFGMSLCHAWSSAPCALLPMLTAQ